MPDRQHHSAKFKSCVEKVMAQGHEESSAYAICTTSFQSAGKDIYAEEADEPRHLHLRAALGQVRTEMLDGEEYLVVPLVALMEGVIHAVNAETPEFVPLSTLEHAAASWNGKPAVLRHPMRGGKQCSANSPEIIESVGLGTIRNARVSGKKLLADAYLHKQKTKQLDPDLFLKLFAGEPVEVSVGAFVRTDDVAGTFNGKPYKANWTEAQGDHIAFLPDGRGACSLEMGCGAHRAASMRVCDDVFELEDLGGPGSGNFGHSGRPGEVGGSDGGGGGGGGGGADTTGGMQTAKRVADDANQLSTKAVKSGTKKDHEEAAKAHGHAVQAYQETGEIKVLDRMLYHKGRMEEHISLAKKTAGKTADNVMDFEASLNPVVRAIRQVQKEQEKVRGLAELEDDFRTAAPLPEGSEGAIGTIKTAAGARNSAVDLGRIQAMHDKAVELGAVCAPGSKFMTMAMKYKDCSSCEGTGSKDGNPCDACNGTGKLKTAAAVPDGELRTACRCSDKKESTMTNDQKAELIAALVTDKFSGFIEGDEPVLEVFTDTRLEALRAASVARQEDADAKTKLENETRAANAKLKVAEDKLRIAKQRPTEDEWIANAPESIKTLIERQRSQDEEKRSDLIATLRAAQSEYTEDDLKAMSVQDLERLSRAVTAKPNFRGRGLPVFGRGSGGSSAVTDYAPPDSYADALKTLREKDASKH